MPYSIALHKLAGILRTDKRTVAAICERMCDLFNKRDVPEKIVLENDKRVAEKLDALKLPLTPPAIEVHRALIRKVKTDEEKISELFKRPRCVNFEGCKTLLNFAQELANVGPGFFLKKEKAAEFLHLNPPPNMMKFFGYKDVDELLAKEDLLEVFSALRFVEDGTWLNNTFFAAYENLTFSDFEARKIEVRVLNGKWLEVAEAFLKKKYHNVSHLKELGVIFIVPIPATEDGETIRLFGLVLHYLHEINFYSRLFQKFAVEEKNFARRLISSLRGDVLETPLENGEKVSWRIVQRYLAKDDEYDFRLFQPHINPEAIHWKKAENDIARLSRRFPSLGLEFWEELDFVGDFFKTEGGDDILISFNLIDTTMSLVKQRELIKYLYHHQEALWNKIFGDFVGEQEMERLIVENFEKGYISL